MTFTERDALREQQSGAAPAPYAAGETTTGVSAARVCTIISFVMAGISVLFAPILFGPAGIILGIVGRSKGDPLGTWAIVASVVGMIAGFALAVAVMNAAST